MQVGQLAAPAGIDVLKVTEHGATCFLNNPYGPDIVWEKLPNEVPQQIIEKELKFYVLDALIVAREAATVRSIGQRHFQIST